MSLKEVNVQRPATTQKSTDMRRILYVEDEDLNWEVTLARLEHRYQLVRAKDAREAFELLKHNEFEGILMDIQLHGSDMSGIEITEVIRGLYRGVPPGYARNFKPLIDTPILFVTAYTARYSRDELIQSGGNDLIAKPVDFTHLSLSLARAFVKSIRKR